MGVSQNKLKRSKNSHAKKWTVNAMAAVKGKKGRRLNAHLLQELQAGARTSSSLCSSGFVGQLSEWVGSFNFPSPFYTQGHDSNIIPLFFMSVQITPNC